MTISDMCRARGDHHTRMSTRAMGWGRGGVSGRSGAVGGHGNRQ